MASQDRAGTAGGLSAAIRHRLRRRVKLVFTMRPDPSASQVGPQGFHLEPGTVENLGRLRREHPEEISERKHQILLERVANPDEDVWIVADESGVQCGFAGVAWRDHLMRKEGFTIRVRPHQVLLIDDYILKGQRRRGAHAASILRRLEVAADRGRSQVRVVIDRRNTASLESFARLGATRVGRIVTFRQWNRSIQLTRPSLGRRRGQ